MRSPVSSQTRRALITRLGMRGGDGKNRLPLFISTKEPV
jgi:hypothetical protein